MRSLEPKPEQTVSIPVVCLPSFFKGSFSRLRRKYRVWTMAALTVFLVLTLTIVLINSQAGFAVFLNGEQIGSAKSMGDVTAVVTDAEKQLKEILGRDYPLDRSISVSADLGVKTDDTENLKDAILGGIDGVVRMHVLEVNGKAVGASSDEKALEGILTSILSEYSTSETSSIRFTDTVSVTNGYVSDNITQDPAVIRELLEPSNTASAFRLSVENTEFRQHTESVPFETQTVKDAAAYEGSSVVKTKGVCGENLITEKTVFVNGVKQVTEIVGTQQTKAPVAEVVAIGTAPRPKTASTGTYIWPTEGVITSDFGPRTGFGSSNHQGIDIGGAYGENIVAADGGTVVKAERCSGYGLLVEVKHDNGDVTYYGHCSELLVGEGDKVSQGQVIAHMGATGEANGVHLHFEIRESGKPVNPMNLLP